jgi:hypothetical protein
MAKRTPDNEVARLIVTCNVQGDYVVTLPYEPRDGEYYVRRVVLPQHGAMRAAYTQEGRQAIVAGTVTQCNAIEVRRCITALFTALMLGPHHA